MPRWWSKPVLVAGGGIGPAQRGLRVAAPERAPGSGEIGRRIHHPAGAHAALRDAIMSAKTDAERYDALARLHGGDGPGEGETAERAADAA